MDLTPDLNASPGMADPRLKMGWAKHHWRTIEGELVKFNQDKPYTFSTEDDLEAKEHVLHFFFQGVPATIGLIFGDFVCCLRSSLDHLAYQLTRLPGGFVNNRASFPVIEIDNSSGRKAFKIATRGIPTDAVALIESLQPYHRGSVYKAAKLWQLHMLWNIDKHRRIPYHLAGIEVRVGHPTDAPPSILRTTYGAVMRFPLSDKAQIKLQPAVNLSIEFGDEAEGLVVGMSELVGIHDYVRDEVLARFDRFFSSP